MVDIFLIFINKIIIFISYFFYISHTNEKSDISAFINFNKIILIRLK